MGSTSSPLPRHLWAKSARGGGQGEGLGRHTAAVVGVLGQLAARSPDLAEIAEDPFLWHRAFRACWLHDAGKAAHAFQAYLRGQRAQWEHRHEVLSLAFLSAVAPAAGEDFPWIAAAIASHHRDAPVVLERRYDPSLPAEDLDLEAMVAELDDATIAALLRWAREGAPAWAAHCGASHVDTEIPAGTPAQPDPLLFRREAPRAIRAALLAYRSLWHAHKSTPGDDARKREGLLLRGLVLLSDRLASAHTAALQPLSLPDAAELLRRAGAPHHRLMSHQERAAATDGSLVLVAPTGSGKTEAALLWARRQHAQSGRSLKLVYLLPYQASANAMRLRLKRQLGTGVGLLHGRGTQVLYRELSEHGYTGPAAERAARRANDLARLHHPPVWVATPYQLLRAAYRLPGYEITWTSIAHSPIVVDEPHAYEPARLGLILGLLRELVDHWGVRVCAMSATLPGWLKEKLREHLHAVAPPVDRALFAAFRRHRLRLLAGEIEGPAAVERIVREVEAGRSVLVGVNTVGRGQIMRTILRDRLGADRVRLLHSRFSGRDRLAKEAEIMARLQAGSGPGEALAVVATQVIEVSLDLDFDTIVTEPAPLEALVQRFGRVNRRGKKGQEGVVPVHLMAEPLGGQGVYDGRLVARTMDVLRTVDGEMLDEASLGALLDQVYADDLARGYADEVERNLREFSESCLRSMRAFESEEGLADQFDRLFDGTEVLPVSLEAGYRREREQSILEAQGLLVPLAHQRLRRLGSAARWNGELSVHVVDLPYDPELGLQLKI